MRKRTLVIGGLLVAVAGIAFGIRTVFFPAPYALADSPAVDVTVRAERSEYPDVAETADEVEPLIKVYVQRLKAGDARALEELSGPAYQQPREDAEKFVREYSDGAGGHVEATVLEGSVPYFNDIVLSYDKTGQKQELVLVKVDGTWWVGLGDGDPAAGNA
ncbi:hypothetical protein [Streptomyces sp. NPDC026673]|uniref:hypothetical protein n=1 Tax=Streptomyces sp. NPDC026673 TaxID=3155724 RepID=UPI0033F093D6